MIKKSRKEEKKQKFRSASLLRLKSVLQKGIYEKDKRIIQSLYQYIKDNNMKSIALYIPLPMEVNMLPLVRKLKKEKKHVYVPFMEGKSFRLVKYRLPLRQKQFGIKEPNNSQQYRNKKIDLLIVPIVGIDSTLRRVGFGKGMYDRFFEKEYKNINKVVFVARALCYSKEVITDHYDIKADMILTP